MSDALMLHKGVAHPWNCDVMGHLTTRYYLGMFDDASYHFLNQVFPDTLKRPNAGWADVRHVIEYTNEVGAGDLLDISGRLSRIGGKSIQVNYNMTNISRNECAATLDATSVLFDLKARKAMSLSDSDREFASTFLQPEDS
ncbi:MAG: acyl-CoA thioesterase [Pseudomonadota bacterium]